MHRAAVPAKQRWALKGSHSVCRFPAPGSNLLRTSSDAAQWCAALGWCPLVVPQVSFSPLHCSLYGVPCCSPWPLL